MAEIRLRQCSHCLLPGIKSIDPDLSGFYLRTVRPPRWRYDCKQCVRERVRSYRLPGGHTGNPRLRQQHWMQRNAGDRYRLMRCELAGRRRADIARHAAHLETQRMAYRLRRELAGVPLQVADDPSAAQGARLDPEPLRAWLQARKVAYGSWETLARACTGPGESVDDRERTLHRICDVRSPQEWVSEILVDQLMSREGSMMLGELYPALG